MSLPPSYLTHGSFQLIRTNGLKVAYKLWSNLPNPEAKQRWNKNHSNPNQSEGNEKVEDEEDQEDRLQRESQLNILALHGRHDNAGTFDHIIPYILAGCAQSNNDIDTSSATTTVPAAAASSSPSSSSTSTNLTKPRRINILCLDLIGHGLSDWRPNDSNYSLVQFLSDLYEILTLLHWRDYMLLGHSMGSILSLILAGTHGVMFPTTPLTPSLPTLIGCILFDPFDYETWRLMDTTIDGIILTPGRDETYQTFMLQQSPFPLTIGRTLEERSLLLSKMKTVYPTLEDAVQAYRRRIKDIKVSSVETLLKRGLKKRPPSTSTPSTSSTSSSSSPTTTTSSNVVDDGFIFTHDPLLNALIPNEFSRSQLRTSGQTIFVPSLMFHFRNSKILEDRAFVRHIDTILETTVFDTNANNVDGLGRIIELSGSHHLHLDEPEQVSLQLNTFIIETWSKRFETRSEVRRKMKQLGSNIDQLKKRARLTEHQELLDVMDIGIVEKLKRLKANL